MEGDDAEPARAFSYRWDVVSDVQVSAQRVLLAIRADDLVDCIDGSGVLCGLHGLLGRVPWRRG